MCFYCFFYIIYFIFIFNYLHYFFYVKCDFVYLFEENTSRLCLGVREEKFEKRMVFHKTKNNLSSFEYLEALPRGLFIILNLFWACFVKNPKLKPSIFLQNRAFRCNLFLPYFDSAQYDKKRISTAIAHARCVRSSSIFLMRSYGAP